MSKSYKSSELLERIVSEDFELFFEENLRPKLTVLEEKRLAELVKNRKLRRMCSFFAGCLLILFVLFLTLFIVKVSEPVFKNLSFLLCIFSNLCFVLLIYYSYKFSKKLNEQTRGLKTSIYNSLFSYAGNFTYLYKDSSDSKNFASNIKKKVKDLKLFEGFNSFRCDDYIFGEYRGRDIEIVDVSLNNRSRYSTETIFQGLVVTVPLDLKFQSATVVRINNKLANPLFLIGMSSIRTGNPEFDDKYKIYTNNENDAYLLLNDSFIKNFMKAAQVPGFELRCAFQNSMLYLAVESKESEKPKNWFELKNGESVLSVKAVQSVLNEFVQALRIVDMLVETEKTDINF